MENANLSFKTPEKLYVGINGRFYKEYELANAYFLSTGEDIWRDVYGDPTETFQTWVNDLMGISLKGVVNMEDVDYRDFLAAYQKVLAVQAYRDRNNCTLKEAKDAIDLLQQQMEREAK